MSEQIHQLLGLLTEAVATLDKSCSTHGTRIPDIKERFHPESETFRKDPAAAEAANIIGAAASQLAAIVMPPQLPLFSVICAPSNAAALRVCLDSNVTEILREAGPNGMHVNDIEAKSGIDARKLGRCLRLLATQNIYSEVKPDVFTNTRISSLLDTMKTSESLFTDPEHKHDETSGLAALANFGLDEIFKASSYLWEHVADRKTAKSGDPAAAPIAMAVGNGKSLWDYLSQPDKKSRQRTFDLAMRGGDLTTARGMALKAFDWNSLPSNALVVDVGGGIGTVARQLIQEHRHLKVVVQDRPEVVENGRQAWQQDMPSALASGQVKFEAHDFFISQPQTNASVFFMKHILHDWSDEYATKILKQLRDAAKTDTKVVCMDAVLPYACRVPGSQIPGASVNDAPEPLIPNWGAVGAMTYYLDVAMMAMCNSAERTIDHFDQLFRGAGWQITAVRRPAGRFEIAAIEAVPI